MTSDEEAPTPPMPDPKPRCNEAGEGRRGTDEMLGELYAELRGLARGLMARERPGQTLQPTALVHEAYLRLRDSGRWQDRGHFYASAAIAMRRILVEKARHARRHKRGGDRQRVTLTDGIAEWHLSPEQVLALDEAMTRLAARDTTMARVAELRFLVGMTVSETAEALDMSTRSVNRAWTGARAWLLLELRRNGATRAMDPPADG